MRAVARWCSARDRVRKRHGPYREEAKGETTEPV